MSIDLNNVQTHQLCGMVADPPQADPVFSPSECWDMHYLAMRTEVSRQGRYVDRAWLPGTIEATQPLVHVPPRLPTAQEVTTLWAYRSLLRTKLRDEILQQDGDATATVPASLRRLLGAQSGPVMETLREPFRLLIREATAVCTQQKLLFNRARPWQAISGMDAGIARPRHASYPSGHATQAFVCALMWCAVLSRVNDVNSKLAPVMADLVHQANRVAVNREIAGVHYPSDTAAGFELAQKIVAGATAAFIGTGTSHYTPEFSAFKAAIEQVL